MSRSNESDNMAEFAVVNVDNLDGSYKTCVEGHEHAAEECDRKVVATDYSRASTCRLRMQERALGDVIRQRRTGAEQPCISVGAGVSRGR